MLPKANRLKTEKDISRLMKAGRSVYAKSVGLKFAANGLAVSRFGFSVGTKISKRATVRNLLKRRLREIVRPRVSSLTKGFDVLVIAKSGLQDFAFRELESEVVGLLARSGLLRVAKTNAPAK